MITENMEEWEDTWQDMAVYKSHPPDQGRGGMRWGEGEGCSRGHPCMSMVKISCCQCRGPALVEKLRSHMLYITAKGEKKKLFFKKTEEKREH